jgi:DNA-binding MarR family transcriptional regulator
MENNVNSDGRYGDLKRKLMHAMYRFKSVGRRKHGFGSGAMHGFGPGAMHGHGAAAGLHGCHEGGPAKHGINMAELIFMKQIAEREADTGYEGTWLSAMSEYLCISKAAVSQMLGSLEKKGYITRETNPENRREIIVRLTKVSEEQLAAHQKVFDHRVDMLIDRFGEQDTKELIRLVNKLADILAEAESDRTKAQGGAEL